jgi:hypothetical protein
LIRDIQAKQQPEEEQADAEEVSQRENCLRFDVTDPTGTILESSTSMKPLDPTTSMNTTRLSYDETTLPCEAK